MTKKAAPARKAAARSATATKATARATAPAAPAVEAAPASTIVVDQSPTPASTPAIASTPPAAAATAPRRRSLAFTVTGIVLVLAAFVLLLKLNAEERGGPTHEFVSIGDGIPATLYVPYDDLDGGLPVPPPKDERVPVIVIAHGYSADQNIMSGLARSFVEAGYAALTFDFRGPRQQHAPVRGRPAGRLRRRGRLGRDLAVRGR